MHRPLLLLATLFLISSLGCGTPFDGTWNGDVTADSGDRSALLGEGPLTIHVTVAGNVVTLAVDGVEEASFTDNGATSLSKNAAGSVRALEASHDLDDGSRLELNAECPDSGCEDTTDFSLLHAQSGEDAFAANLSGTLKRE